MCMKGIRQRNTLPLNITISMFIDEFVDGLQARLAIAGMSLTYLEKG